MSSQELSALAELGVRHVNEGRPTEALAVFDQALRLNPPTPELLYGRAFALARLGRREESLTALTTLLSTHPRHSSALLLYEQLKQRQQISQTDYKLSTPVAASEPLRFLQLHTFYGAYLQAFYNDRQSLATQPFKTQIAALVEDGFGANHMFAPYLTSLKYDSQLIIVNCEAAQVAWCHEHGITELTTDNWIHEITRLQIEHYRPEILYTGDPLVLDSKFMRTLSYAPQLVVGWRAAQIPVDTDWSTFDLMLSHLGSCRAKALQLGAAAVENFHPGIPPLIPNATANEPKLHDVVFSGGWTPEHDYRNSLITLLAQEAQRKRFSLALYLLSHHYELPRVVTNYNHGERWGLEMYRVLKQAAIVVNAEIDLARGEAGNSRMFETTGVGSFLLTEYQPNIDEYFKPGVEIETYESREELLEKIDYYLAHPTEREAIAKRGQKRCLAEYSMEAQCTKFDRILRSHLATKRALISANSPAGNNTDQVSISTNRFTTTENVMTQQHAITPITEDQSSPAKAAAVFLEEGVAALNAGENRTALQAFDRAIALGVDVPQLFLGRAVALARLGEVMLAISELTRLIQRIPDFLSAKQLLDQLKQAPIGFGRQGTSQTPGATRDLQRPSAPSTTRPSDLVQEILQLNQTGLAVDGMRRAEQALRTGPAQPELNYAYACCLETVGRCEEAFEALKAELLKNPGHTAANSSYERLLNALKQKQRPRLNPEQRSYTSAIPRDALDSIQNASHSYSYRGVPMIKNAFDFAIYPLLLWDVKPRTIIEIGSKEGGSALWFADTLTNFGVDAHIYSIDIVRPSKVAHPRVTFIEGNGRKLQEVLTPDFLSSLPRPLLVIEDADHSYETSSAVLSFFSSVLGPDEYIIIEDGIISDLNRDSDCNSGPHRALKEFFANHPGEYDIDQRYCDFFGYNYTWCTNGFLRKKRYPLNQAIKPELISVFNTEDPAPRGIESQMSVNERFQMFYLINQLLPRGRSEANSLVRFVEIGSHSGASLTLIYRSLCRTFAQVQGFSVEPCGQPQFYEVLEQLRGAVGHVKALSHDAAVVLKEFFNRDQNLPELIFVDGDHSYQGVRQDIIDYYPLLKPGGIMVFHDYLPPVDEINREAIFFHHGGKEPGIRQACEELMVRDYRCELLELPLLYPTDPTQTQPHLPVIPGVFSTLRAYRKPAA